MNTANLAARRLLALFLLAVAFAKLINHNPNNEQALILDLATACEIALGILSLSRHWQIAAWSGILLGAFGILVDQLGLLSSTCGCLGGLEKVPGIKTMASATIGILSVAALKTGHTHHAALDNSTIDQARDGDLATRPTKANT
jgi:hypothetical protein